MFTDPRLHGGASTTSVSAGVIAQESTKNREGLWNAFMITLTQWLRTRREGVLCWTSQTMKNWSEMGRSGEVLAIVTMRW